MQSLTEEVKDLFQPRSKLLELRNEAANALNQDEWLVYKKVVQNFEGERKFTARQYELDYQNRFDQVRRRLIDEAGAVKRKLTCKRFGADNFNKTEIDRRAHITVRAEHGQTMAQIDQSECEAIRPLVENAQSKIDAREKPIKDFQAAVDRRSGQDRRVQSWSR